MTLSRICLFGTDMSNPFIGLDRSVIQSHLDRYLEAHLAIATTGQSYTLEGRSLSRANLPQIEDTIGKLNSALRIAKGETATRVLPNFSAR